MKKPSLFMRAVALMILIVIGLMGNVAFRALPTDDYSPKVEMVELRFVPANWWGLN